MLRFNLKDHKDADTRVVEIDFPESSAELLDAEWTHEDIFAHAIANITVKVQGRYRQHAKRIADGKDSELPTNWVTWAKHQEKLSNAERTQKQALQQSDDEKKALIAALKASMK